jgi:hypothetical protein
VPVYAAGRNLLLFDRMLIVLSEYSTFAKHVQIRLGYIGSEDDANLKVETHISGSEWLKVYTGCCTFQ